MIEVAKADAVVLMGGDNSFNGLYVQPEIHSYADLRGKTVVVDAPDTAYALQLYKMLQVHGLQKGDDAVKPVGGTPLRLEALREDKRNAVAVLNPPFSVLAEKEGFRRLALAWKSSDRTGRRRRSPSGLGPRHTPIPWSGTSEPTWRGCAGRWTRRTSRKPCGCWPSD